MNLDNLITLIPLDEFHVISVFRLFCPYTGNPYLVSLDRTFQRFNLPDKTTFLSIFRRLIEARRSFGTDQFFHRFCSRIISLYRELVESQRSVPYIISLRKQTTCIEGKNTRRSMYLR